MTRVGAYVHNIILFYDFKLCATMMHWIWWMNSVKTKDEVTIKSRGCENPVSAGAITVFSEQGSGAPNSCLSTL